MYQLEDSEIANTAGTPGLCFSIISCTTETMVEYTVRKITKSLRTRAPDFKTNMTIAQTPWREARNYIIRLDNADCTFHVRGQLANIFRNRSVRGRYGRFAVRFVMMKLTILPCPLLESCLEFCIPHTGSTEKISGWHEDLKVAKLFAGTQLKCG
jgi:hypothetical protein